MTNYRIRVTEADIGAAIPKDSARCALATAIARQIPGAARIEVDIATIRWTAADGERFIYSTPYLVQDYVIDFDAGEEINPFRCYLNDRNRIGVRSHRKTEAGKEIDKASATRKRRTAKVDKLARVAAGELDATPAEREAARALLPDAAAAAAQAAATELETRAAHAGTVTKKQVGDGRTRAPKRANKTRQRQYGHRVLRINREIDRAEALKVTQ